MKYRIRHKERTEGQFFLYRFCPCWHFVPAVEENKGRALLLELKEALELLNRYFKSEGPSDGGVKDWLQLEEEGTWRPVFRKYSPRNREERDTFYDEGVARQAGEIRKAKIQQVEQQVAGRFKDDLLEL